MMQHMAGLTYGMPALSPIIILSTSAFEEFSSESISFIFQLNSAKLFYFIFFNSNLTCPLKIEKIIHLGLHFVFQTDLFCKNFTHLKLPAVLFSSQGKVQSFFCQIREFCIIQSLELLLGCIAVSSFQSKGGFFSESAICFLDLKTKYSKKLS